MTIDFHIKAHAKWILAGEHAVLRGHPALVFPIPGKFIELTYVKGDKSLEVEFNASYEETFLVLFWGVFEEALTLLNKKHQDIRGNLSFRNNIPMGAGMGFSAAFCVSLTKFFEWNGWISPEEAFEFARKLEDHFHGKSSGVDIAGSLYNCGVHYQMNHTPEPLSLKWRPHLYLSHSGHISVTSKCVNLVKELWQTNEALAKKLDLQMAESVKIAEKSLAMDEKEGNKQLKNALELAENCFLQWGLINTDLDAHLTELKKQGALACKPTGAGDGGFVLSLWDKLPDLPFEMIAVF